MDKIELLNKFEEKYWDMFNKYVFGRIAILWLIFMSISVYLFDGKGILGAFMVLIILLMVAFPTIYIKTSYFKKKEIMAKRLVKKYFPKSYYFHLEHHYGEKYKLTFYGIDVYNKYPIKKDYVFIHNILEVETIKTEMIEKWQEELVRMQLAREHNQRRKNKIETFNKGIND